MLLGIELYTRFRENLEPLAAHEMAHQWWYNIVHNDPVNEPWLDEALAEYSMKIYMEAMRGEDDAGSFQVKRWQTPLDGLRAKGQDTAVDQPVDQFPQRYAVRDRGLRQGCALLRPHSRCHRHTPLRSFPPQLPGRPPLGDRRHRHVAGRLARTCPTPHWFRCLKSGSRHPPSKSAAVSRSERHPSHTVASSARRQTSVADAHSSLTTGRLLLCRQRAPIAAASLAAVG